MGYWLAILVGSAMGMYVLSRATLWLFKGMGDNAKRIWTAQIAAVGFATIASAYAAADHTPPNFLASFIQYGLAALVGLGADLWSLRLRTGRRHIIR